jgi:hypothetical protein
MDDNIKITFKNNVCRCEMDLCLSLKCLAAYIFISIKAHKLLERRKKDFEGLCASDVIFQINGF